MVDLPNLLPASWRGVPFAVEDDSVETGRRFVANQYPGRDGQKLQDLGRRGGRYRVKGFIVTDGVYGGGPIELQRQVLKAAAELKGTGILVHPSWGILTLGCESCSIGNGLDAGTKAAVEFIFLEDTQQSLLGISTSTIAAVASAAVALDAVASTAFTVASISGLAVSSASAQWSAAVTNGGQDATALTNLASQLPGNYGRYFAGANSGYLGSAPNAFTGDTTVSDLVADAATARAAIGAAAATVAAGFATMSSSTAASVATSVQALVAALLQACADPADALRILSGLAATTPTGVTGVDDLYRRAVVSAACRTSSSYQPSSQDDAANVQQTVTGLLDQEIEIAGDEGQDDVYQALKTLRQGVVADLQSRGAALAPLATFTFAAPLPALTLAQRLYGDGSRADELVAEANPIHPLFMPLSFQALAE